MTDATTAIDTNRLRKRAPGASGATLSSTSCQQLRTDVPRGRLQPGRRLRNDHRDAQRDPHFFAKPST